MKHGIRASIVVLPGFLPGFCLLSGRDDRPSFGAWLQSKRVLALTHYFDNARQ
jgi:hypothetical protein